jgi:hypothetical protein
LNTQTDGLASAYAARQIGLERGALEPTDRERHRRAAEAAFATHLPVSPDALQIPDLVKPAYENPLEIHMTILLALLGDELADTSEISLRERVRTGLLRREHERWARTLRGRS